MSKLDHSQNIIELRDVSFAYEGEEVLREVTLDLHPGDYLGVVGPNGSGKTTLLKIILGLLKPRSGSVKLAVERSRLGYVPQRVLNFDPNFPATVEEVVLMGRYAGRGLFHPVQVADREAVKRALETVEMAQYHDRLIGSLSGGQAQRVFIARALVNDPEVIFFDEPTTGVDQASRQEFYALLRKLNTESQITLVLVSHEIDTLKKEAMHLACIDKTLVYFGSAGDFEHHHQHH